MFNKKNHILPAVTALLWAAVLTVDFVIPDKYFSSQENRKLAQKPACSLAAVLDGSYMEQYGEYVADQLPARNAFITVMTKTQRLMGKKDVNGVYFAPGNTLAERHMPESVDQEKAARKAERMLAQAARLQERIKGRAVVMLIPSSGAVQSHRLPVFAEEFDQLSWIGGVYGAAAQAGLMTVDADKPLLAHSREAIYYGTDHHWTTAGAFYGYQAFCNAMGLMSPDRTDYEAVAVKEDFWGTLQAKVNLPVSPDVIEIYTRQGEKAHPVRYVYEEKEADSCYFYECLQTGDPYAFFLNGNYPLVEMEGDGDAKRSILVIKDSFANCFVPFLTRDYGTIWLLDPRYYRGDVEEVVREYTPTDVLYLYNIFQLIES